MKSEAEQAEVRQEPHRQQKPGKSGLVMALVVLALANTGVWAGVIWNRSGIPTGEISFTQCDFVDFTNDASGSGRPQPFIGNLYLSIDGLEIGQDNAERLGRFYQGYVAVSRGGEAWVKHYNSLSENDRRWNSSAQQLLAVAVSHKAEELLADYGTDGHSAVLPAYVGVDRWVAQNHLVQVGDEMRATLSSIPVQGEDCIPSHRITVNWGQRYEPWISEVVEIR
ncbi:hypothetical protein O4H49_03630 [Kiloniella laminariae]|uniref:Uncharacterized protein n=1 Tax=Kiloniella laminariae TaxID=454162 RepID=A0ABT4LFH3_9PROT|nr:hypothetical protein [Kiloniella laminariae]MCZ4279854.1 hypothetical protein [Kiloniella laminariae]